MKRLTIKTEKREVVGRKVKKLRKEGILPVNIYGSKIKSQSLFSIKENPQLLSELKKEEILFFPHI